MLFDVESYAKDKLSDVRVSSRTRKGIELVASCPFCGKPDHFYIQVATGKFICFKCEERGKNIVPLVAHLEGIEYDRAWEYVRRNSIVTRREGSTQTLAQKISALRRHGTSGTEEGAATEYVDVPLPDEFVPVYDAKMDKWHMPKYLVERGITKATAKHWGLGLCNRGRYSGRVVMPIECPNGLSFTARDTTGKQQPKYLNPKGADHGKLVYGWKHTPMGADIILVEGPMDAVKMWQHGMPAMALLGKMLKQDQFELLCSRPDTAAVVVMLDPEEKTAPLKVAAQLNTHFRRVYIAALPEGVDPGASMPEQAKLAHDHAATYTGDRASRLSAAVAEARKRVEKMLQ